jgi:biotin operon repressor
MKFIERKQKLVYLLKMIEKGRCISLEQISEKFECSKRTIRRMIEELREDGHNIKYCRTNQKFYKEIG